MTAAACNLQRMGRMLRNLQRMGRMLRNNLYYLSFEVNMLYVEYPVIVKHDWTSIAC